MSNISTGKHPLDHDTTTAATITTTNANTPGCKRYRYAAPDDSLTTKALSEHKLATAKECSGIPKFDELKKCFWDEIGAGDFLMQEKIALVLEVCPRCHKKLPPPDKKRMQRCHVRQCMKKEANEFCQSIYRHSFFEDSRGGRYLVLLFLYHWVIGSNYKQMGIVTGWSRQKVFSYIKYVQDLVATVAMTHHDFLNNNDTTTPIAIAPIGGEGIVVEIDDEQQVFDKRKLHVQEGSWLFGGVENTLTRRYFCVAVPDRNPSTLCAIIHKFIAPGSLVRSDCWTAKDIVEIDDKCEYICGDASDQGMLWDDDDPLLLPPTWYANTRPAPARKKGKRQQAMLLFEYIWRRQHETKLWEGLLDALRQVKYASSNATLAANKHAKKKEQKQQQQQAANSDTTTNGGPGKKVKLLEQPQPNGVAGTNMTKVKEQTGDNGHDKVLGNPPPQQQQQHLQQGNGLKPSDGTGAVKGEDVGII
ncbi:DDE_Tnp_IS1595 [Seminavis robusta]|uniref:DDE_Tnp_IS1595 n=1 Tax=Seminavis robusta TaxID=568900 RepID=A0A9N8DHJ0_9STRA|nr:DDE_Tnp_IS1595 [Seminavis robusta]|eukprot:Sro93_g048610.1 DDE_Tnp_IS1595 (474) ;mRNA; f:85038-86459